MELEAHETFEKKDVKFELDEALLKLDYSFFKEIDELKKKLVNEFKLICKRIIEYQKINNFTISYIGFVHFFTDLLEKNAVCNVLLYDNEWYKKEYIQIGKIDISRFYDGIYRMWDSLSQKRKKYAGKIFESQVEQIIIRESKKFYEYFNLLLKYSIEECISSKEFMEVSKSRQFLLYSGELINEINCIYEITYEKNSFLKLKYEIADNKNLFNYTIKDEYFEEVLINKLIMQNCVFEGVNFKGVKIINSNVIDCKFIDCKFENASFINCNIDYIKFKDVELKFANFSYAYCESGYNSQKNWSKASSLESTFINVDLSNATFKNAAFIGVDFTSCILDNTKFTNAKLDRSKFTKKQVQNLNICEKQRSVIEVI